MGAGASVGQFETCDQFEQVMKVEDCFSSPAAATDSTPSSREKGHSTVGPRLSVDIPAAEEGTEAGRPPALLPHLLALFMARTKGRGEASVPVHEFWDLVEALFAHVLSDFDNTRLEVWLICAMASVTALLMRHTQMYLDVKTDNPVTWREANEYFTVQFKLLKQRPRDCWVIVLAYMLLIED